LSLIHKQKNRPLQVMKHQQEPTIAPGYSCNNTGHEYEGEDWSPIHGTPSTTATVETTWAVKPTVCSGSYSLYLTLLMKSNSGCSRATQSLENC